MGLRGLFDGWHLPLLIIVLVLLFGAKRLPDAARGLGRSLRIFKAETEGLRTDGAPVASVEAAPPATPAPTTPAPTAPAVAEPVAEQAAPPQQPNA